MDTTTTTNAHAAALVDEMIHNAESQIKLVNSMLAGALQELERRNAKAQIDLLNGLGITDTGISSSAHKVETLLVRRTQAYNELRSLEHVRKAC